MHNHKSGRHKKTTAIITVSTYNVLSRKTQKIKIKLVKLLNL